MCLGQNSIRVDSEISIETNGQHNIAFSGNNNIDFWYYNSVKINGNPFFPLAIYTGINFKLNIS